MAFPVVATALDYASVSGEEVDGAAEIGTAIDSVAANVQSFREASNVARPIVIYLGSPAMRAHPPLCDIATECQLRSRAHNSVPGSLIYAAGAICAGADFVDFTPSEALTSPALWSLADANGMQLVGRDGSTGQTMLKAAVASMLKIRGLAPRSWYSSNHLGNEDGRILAEPDYRWLKLADKARGLEELVGGDVDHVVSIDYMSSKGDRKESFDSVTARDLFGGEVRLRLNWEAWDSALAATMLLDVIRLVLLGQTLELRGVQGQLGFFFKSPLGAACMSPEQAHREMVAFYNARRA
jgi:myo-inositol-1-phosphate synthase